MCKELGVATVNAFLLLWMAVGLVILPQLLNLTLTIFLLPFTISLDPQHCLPRRAVLDAGLRAGARAGVATYPG